MEINIKNLLVSQVLTIFVLFNTVPRSRLPCSSALVVDVSFMHFVVMVNNGSELYIIICLKK